MKLFGMASITHTYHGNAISQECGILTCADGAQCIWLAVKSQIPIASVELGIMRSPNHKNSK
eukprot:3267855-Amphidinium_carterae.1